MEDSESDQGVEKQSTDEQIASLIQELQEQNQALEGRMLASIPVSKDDIRPVLLFRVTHTWAAAQQDISLRAAFGVHPDKGPIVIKEQKRPERIGVVDFLKRDAFGKNAPLEVNFAELDIVNNAKVVSTKDELEFWEDYLQKSRRTAELDYREEAAKKQFIPLALEAVRKISTSQGTPLSDPTLGNSEHE